MPTIITTEPHVNDTVPGTTFRPDEDGMIGDTEETTHTTDNTAPQPRNHRGMR